MSTLTRPNYFVGVKLNVDCSLVRDVQKSIVEVNLEQQMTLDISKCMTPVEKMHFTAFVLTLSTEEEVLAAGEALADCQQCINAPATITLGDIELIGKQVLYISPKQDAGFDALRATFHRIFQSFQRRNLLQQLPVGSMDPDAWIEKWLPHATIAKTSADRKNGRKIKFHRELTANCRSAFDGLQISLERIDLLEMTKMDDEGYYKSHCTIRFPPNER